MDQNRLNFLENLAKLNVGVKGKSWIHLKRHFAKQKGGNLSQDLHQEWPLPGIKHIPCALPIVSDTVIEKMEHNLRNRVSPNQILYCNKKIYKKSTSSTTSCLRVRDASRAPLRHS